jgi:hypothetical protein
LPIKLLSTTTGNQNGTMAGAVITSQKCKTVNENQKVLLTPMPGSGTTKDENEVHFHINEKCYGE